MKKLITVTESSESMRLDKYLFCQFPDFSRSYFQGLIQKNHIQINSKDTAKSSYKIRIDDHISIDFQPINEFDLTPKKVDFEILDVQDDFIVINKPAGIVVHNSESNKEEPSLVNGLLYHFKELNKFESNQRPGIVHRLDRNTSGILLVAKTPQAQKEFADIFSNRKISKTYLAVVDGHPDKEGQINFPIGRNPKKRHKMSHLWGGGKPALTKYKVQEYFKNNSLVEASIITGRTHQIRVHFSAIGHRIIGDDMYGLTSKFIKRQALHAWQISFEFKGKPFTYTCPIPDDINKLLEKFRKEN